MSYHNRRDFTPRGNSSRFPWRQPTPAPNQPSPWQTQSLQPPIGFGPAGNRPFMPAPGRAGDSNYDYRNYFRNTGGDSDSDGGGNKRKNRWDSPSEVRDRRDSGSGPRNEFSSGGVDSTNKKDDFRRSRWDSPDRRSDTISDSRNDNDFRSSVDRDRKRRSDISPSSSFRLNNSSSHRNSRPPSRNFEGKQEDLFSPPYKVSRDKSYSVMKDDTIVINDSPNEPIQSPRSPASSQESGEVNESRMKGDVPMTPMSPEGPCSPVSVETQDFVPSNEVKQIPLSPDRTPDASSPRAYRESPKPPPTPRSPSPRPPPPEPSPKQFYYSPIPPESPNESPSTSLKPPMPTYQPPIPSYEPPPPPLQAQHFCRLCNIDKAFRTDYDFDVHLTMIHYTERIMKRIKPPFRCLKCGYMPMSTMSENEKKEDLLMHYGCEEKVAALFYSQDCANLPEPEVKTERPVNLSITCKICNSSHESERLFVRHISMRHFCKELIEDLPKKAPFKCPFIDCYVEKPLLHNLMMHYGCDHNVSMELYLKKFEEKDDTKDADTSVSLSEGDIEEEQGALIGPKYSTSSSNLGGSEKRLDILKSPPISSLTTSSPDTSFSKEPSTSVVTPKISSISSIRASTIQCTMCKRKTSFITQKSLNYHLMMTHFFPDLPKNGPYPCPRCKQSFSEKNAFAKHFLQDHFNDYIRDKDQKKVKEKDTKSSKKSIDLPRKSSNSSKSKSSSSHHSSKSKSKERERDKERHRHKSRHKDKDKDKSKSKSTPQAIVAPFVHTEDTSTQATPKASAVVKPTVVGVVPRRNSVGSDQDNGDNDDDDDNNNDDDTSSRDESDAIPAARVMRTIHRPKLVSPSPKVISARQRMLAKWEKTSLDAQNHKIEELQQKIKEMEEFHKESTERKATEFERWVTLKEKSLEEEEERRKALEDKLEQANVDNVDLKKQLEQKQDSYKGLEEMLIEKHNLNHQLMKEKKDFEKQNKSLTSEISNFEGKLSDRDVQIVDLEQKLERKTSAIIDLNITISMKDEELKEVAQQNEKVVADNEKQIQKLEKQIDNQKNKIENLNEDKKSKASQIKEMMKKHKDNENELNNKLTASQRQVKSLERELAVKNAEVKVSSKKLEKDQSKLEKKMEEYELQMKEKDNENDKLESQNRTLLDNFEKLQRMVYDFEGVIKEKKEVNSELTSKLEESEMNLSDALEKLKDQKNSDKEKKDLQRQVKQLQATLKDWEARQFTNVKLISGLQKEREEHLKKIKDFEENHTGAEEELYEMDQEKKKLEKEVKSYKKKVEELEQDHAKLNARLLSKNEEITTLSNEKIETEKKVREYEKSLRSTDDKSKEIDSLKSELKNRQNELDHLRTSILQMKSMGQQSKNETLTLKNELKESKERNDKFEQDYSQTVTQLETFKNVIKMNSRLISAKDKEIAQLKEKLSNAGIENKLIKQELNIDDTSTNNTINTTNVNEKIKLEQILPEEIKKEPLDEGDHIMNEFAPGFSFERPSTPEPPEGRSSRVPIPFSPNPDMTPPPPINPPFQNLHHTPIKHSPKAASTIPSVPDFLKQLKPVKPTKVDVDTTKKQIIFCPSALVDNPATASTSSTIIKPPSTPTHTKPATATSSVPTPSSSTITTNDLDNIGDLDDLEDLIDYNLDDIFPETDFDNIDPGSLSDIAMATNLSNAGSCNSSISGASSSTNKDRPVSPYTPVPLSEAKKKKSALEDVTGMLDENGDIVCGICRQYDPPLPPDSGKKKSMYTTEWVGCDCDRWFHKWCTKMKSFRKTFSCKSVKMTCIGEEPEFGQKKKRGPKPKKKTSTGITNQCTNFTIQH